VKSYSSFWNLGASTTLSLNIFKGFLAAKKPVVLGIPVTASFRSPDANGFVSPKLFQESSSGHAVLAVGFISSLQARTKIPSSEIHSSNGGGWIIIKNSWGCDWGDAGYGYLPYSWVEHYVRDATALDGLTSYTPIVTLTSNTSTVSTPTGLKLTALASPFLNPKRVGKVEFFDDPSKIGEVTSSNLNGSGIFELNVPTRSKLEQQRHAPLQRPCHHH
jgi:Papain family cysteine protease